MAGLRSGDSAVFLQTVGIPRDSIKEGLCEFHRLLLFLASRASPSPAADEPHIGAASWQRLPYR